MSYVTHVYVKNWHLESRVKKPERTKRFWRRVAKNDALALRYALFRNVARDLLVRISRHHRLAVCAIFRDEASFLDEWLRFHSAAGVGHFYLYNNFSTDGYRAVLKPWIDRGLVTLYEWPHETGQLAAYRHCVQNHWRDAWWIAFIDIDEFLFSPASNNLVPILDRYTDVPALVVYSLFFGSSAHQNRPLAPVTMSYLRRARVEVASSGKTIANPRRIRAIKNCHIFRYWKGAELIRTAVHCEKTALKIIFRSIFAGSITTGRDRSPISTTKSDEAM